jgi:circadian clock protein KaiC
LDQITEGGLPRGRPTLICGAAGSGKSLLAIEFLVRGATNHKEPGVFVSFEERPADLVANTASLGFELRRLLKAKLLYIEHITVDRTEIAEAGEYNLDGLFVRLGAAIDSVRAKRVALDTLEVLFAAFGNMGILRAELHRLFGWLKHRGVTAVVTAERGDGTGLTRQGLEEYVSDCVLLLDQRLTERIATRRIRVVKYRGSLHGTNEYPFLIDSKGFVVLPITSIALDYPALRERISTGIPNLDAMLGGKGYFRGSTLMVSGASGTGKTSIAAQFVDAACRRGERCVYFAFEESPMQIARNIQSIGIDLHKWVKGGRLLFSAARPATYGLEMHINMMLKVVEEFRPHVVVLDPVSSFRSAGTHVDALAMLMRLLDVFKSRQISTILNSLSNTAEDEQLDQGTAGVSSLVDVWIQLRNLEQLGERTRSLYVLKARGVEHSNQVRELIISDEGVDLAQIHIGPDGILVGSARLAQQLRDRVAANNSRNSLAHKRELLSRKRTAFKARIAELRTDFLAESHDIERAIALEADQQNSLGTDRAKLVAERESGIRRPHLSARGGAK